MDEGRSWRREQKGREMRREEGKGKKWRKGGSENEREEGRGWIREQGR